MNTLLLYVIFILAPKQKIAPEVWMYNNDIHRQLEFYVPPNEELWAPLPTIEYDENCEPYNRYVTDGDTGEVITERVEPTINPSEQPISFARCIQTI